MEIADFGIMALHPPVGIDAVENASIAIAASRAGGIGILDAEFLDEEQIRAGLSSLLTRSAGKPVGIRCGIAQVGTLENALTALASGSKNSVVLCGIGDTSGAVNLHQVISLLHLQNLSVFCEAISEQEVRLADECGADFIIVKGNEAAGLVGEETALVLLQRCLRVTERPLWLQGGIGFHTAAAAFAGGARGVVLDCQLWLTRESPLGPLDRELIGRMDGTETLCLPCGEHQFRVRLKTGSESAAKLQSDLEQLETSDSQRAVLVHEFVKSQLRDTIAHMPLYPVGQDAAFASNFAEKCTSVAAVISNIRASVAEHCSKAQEAKPFAEGAPLALSNKTKYPILQGAMTRVSDTAEFAYAVASNGGLPFLALALMRGEEVQSLLKATAEKLGELSWGVGILGFVPQQLRQEQTAVIEKFRPPFALIAGGRPDQAAELESQGTKTYLHVPSPLLLESFIESGSKRFIFEGRECGGHVGPRSSFVLWEQMIDVVLRAAAKGHDPRAFEIVFAGGIHDELSAAMVAAMSAPLAAAGVKLGLLMGTAYLFTQEAVSSGAICEPFQKAALDCSSTVLLETGPGHAIRCLESPYKKTFDETRRKLEQEGRGKNEVRQELELMNLGRLRTASKGMSRSESGSGLVSVPPEKQWKDGMFMIGQVAALHHERTTIGALHQAVCKGSSDLLDKMAQPQSKEEQFELPGGEPVAIVGMSCMFPKANDLQAFWENILNKVDTIEEVPAYQWDVNRLYDKNPFARDKISSKWGGFLQDIPFNPALYGIPPSSLASIDPMQLLILEVTRAAIADAGYDTRPFDKKRTSVILANAGHGPITAFYSLRSMLDWTLADMPEEYRKVIEERLPEWTEDSFPGYLGNVVAGRVANRFDLGGINYCIDAACASSLAALHSAVRELRAKTSDCVLLASTDTHNQPGDYLSFSKTHALSPRGRCRTFDATADGIVISEGLAVLMLKRLSDAERDGDRIYAVIRGIGGSSDGRDLSLTAPRPAGQMLALQRAYKDAGVSPETVELVEAHGTGTVAGDKAEVEALTKVFKAAGASTGNCAIGSVKTMIGHTKCSAGLASMIKVAKSLYHKILPPTLGVETPNPACDFASSPFYINSEVRPWLHGGKRANTPRRAGISAFGFGGTNFHTVLEEYTGLPFKSQDSAYVHFPSELFVLRGASRESLLKYVAALETSTKNAQKSANRPHGPVTDASRTSFAELAYKTFLKNQTSGQKGQVVLSVVAADFDDLTAKLAQARKLIADESKETQTDPRGIYFSTSCRQNPKVAFLFPGQGSQQLNMLRDLSLVFKEVRDSFEQADSILEDKLGTKLSSFVFPAPAFTDEERSKQQLALTDTHVAQPAVAAADLAVLRLLTHFNVKPFVVAGHSFGEYAALCAAKALKERDLIKIAERRGAILSKANSEQSGTMAAVGASAQQLQPLMHELSGITLANINSPKQCIISGKVDAIKNAITRLAQHGLKSRPIAVSAAFHSPLMDSARADLFAELTLLDFEKPTLKVLSNTTAEPYSDEHEDYADLLARHLVEPVRFQDEIESMYADGVDIFVECGPGAVLTGLVADILSERKHVCVSIERNGRNGVVQLLHALAILSVNGVEPDLQRLYAHRFDGRFTTSGDNSAASPKKALHFLVNSAQIRRFDPETGHVHEAPKRVPTEADVQARKSATLSTTRPVSSASGGETLPVEVKVPGANTQRVVQGTMAPGVAVTSSAAANTKTASTTKSAGMDNSALQKSPLQSKPTALSTQSPAVSSERTASAQRAVPGAVTPTSGSPRPSAGGATGRDRMMLEFQKNMLEMTSNFLQTQERVMMAYLGSEQAPLNNQAGSSNHFAVDLAAQVPLQTSLQTWSAPTDLAASQKPVTARPSGKSVPPNGNGNGHHKEELTERQLHAQLASTLNQNQRGAESTKANQNTGSQLDPEALIASLISIVSERTGYPPEMLDPSLDLEADLGIDSIKRVEILNNFRKLLPEVRQQSLESGIEKLAATKTLQGIMDWIRTDLVNAGTEAAADSPASLPEHAQGTGDASVRAEAKTSVIARGVAKLTPLPDLSVDIRSGHCLLVGPKSETGEEMLKLLAGSNVQTSVLIDLKDGQSSVDERQGKFVAVDFHDLPAMESAIRTHDSVSPITHVLFFADSEICSEVEYAKRTVHSLFVLSKALNSSLKAKSWRFIAVTEGDGSFGLTEPSKQPVLGGIAGIMKTVAREWATVKSSAIELASGLSAPVSARLLSGELANQDSPPEVGYSAEAKRFGVEVVAAPLPTNGASPRKLNLDKSSVVLVTGGARGITCDLAHSIAQDYKCTLIILGRGERPKGDEAAWSANLHSAGELKSAIMAQLKQSGKPVSIPAVESIYRELMKEREMRTNFNRLEKTGATIHYYPLDVRNEVALSDTIDRVHDMFGKVDAVIHGAGVIEDAYIKDKSPDSFDRVFRTKVDSALVLARKLQSPALKYFVLLSSVVGRTGNAGQADYVAANEVLNKLAGNLKRNTKARVVSLGWGPWRGGMARPELEAIFATYGWAMIETQEGVANFRNELAYGSPEDVEILLVGKPNPEHTGGNPNLNAGQASKEAPSQKQVVGRSKSDKSGSKANDNGNGTNGNGQPDGKDSGNGNGNGSHDQQASKHLIRSLVKAATTSAESSSLHGTRLHGAIAKEKTNSVLESTFRLDPTIDVYLTDHTFDSMPVLPMAVANELFWEAGSNLRPGYSACAISKLEIPAGIVFENGSKELLLRAAIEAESSDAVLVSMSLSSGSNRKRINFACQAELNQTGFRSLNHPVLPARFRMLEAELPITELPTPEFIYRNWMFHGPLFQGIDSVDAFGQNLIIGTVTTSKLSDCVNLPNAAPWALDPILLDSVMQLAGVWARQYLGITVLPTGFKRLTKTAPMRSGSNTYRAIVAIPSELVSELLCDLAVYDAHTGEMVLLMEGLNGVGNKNLNRLSANQINKRLRSSKR